MTLFAVIVFRYGSVMPGLTDGDLCDIVQRNFDFRPGCIQRDLKLKEPQVRWLVVEECANAIVLLVPETGCLWSLWSSRFDASLGGGKGPGGGGGGS